MREEKIKGKVIGAYFTSLVSITLVLLLFSIIGLLLINAKNLSDFVKENLCFSLIIKGNVKDPDIKQYQKTLDTYSYIKATEFISAEDATKILQEDLGEDFLETLGFNPLSPTINVYLWSQYANPDSIANLEKFFLSQTDYVDEVSYQQNLVHLIHDNVSKISVFLLVFCAALFIISFALLNNTIRLMIYSKRFIINTMKLVGAKRSFIRRPFIRYCVLQGFIGAIISLLVLTGIIYFLNDKIANEVFFADKTMLAILYVIIIVLGLLLSYLSTYLSVNKYLKLKSSNLYY